MSNNLSVWLLWLLCCLPQHWAGEMWWTPLQYVIHIYKSHIRNMKLHWVTKIVCQRVIISVYPGNLQIIKELSPPQEAKPILNVLIECLKCDWVWFDQEIVVLLLLCQFIFLFMWNIFSLAECSCTTIYQKKKTQYHTISFIYYLCFRLTFKFLYSAPCYSINSLYTPLTVSLMKLFHGVLANLFIHVQQNTTLYIGKY